MAGMFGGGASVTRYTSVDIQTSAYGVCIPILWGRNRAGVNIIWLNDFQAKKQKSGGKGGGGKGGSSYDYTVALIMAICEGPIQGAIGLFKDNQQYALASVNLGLYNGDAGQTAPSWIASKYPAQASGYPRTAFAFSSKYDLGSSPQIPNHDFEVNGFLQGSSPVSGSPDVNPADIIADATYGFITSAQFGLDPEAAYVDPASLAAFRIYCLAQGIAFSPYLRQQEQGTQTLQRWAQLSNAWIFWSGSKLKFVPLGVVPLSANSATYTPQLTPIYNLGVNDLVVTDTTTGALVTVTRADPYDGYNRVEIDARDRYDQYNTVPTYWEDQTSIDAYGQMQSQTITADEICDPTVAAIVAALVGWRSVYIRNSYAFSAGYQFIALEPGDIVSLTDPGVGLLNVPVRITEVEEDEAGLLKFKAEECPASNGISALFTAPTPAGNNGPDLQVDPGNVNPPLFVEPPISMAGGTQELWIGASGGANWGGADVWASTDGTNYSLIGAITEPVAQGVLSAALPYAVGTDTADTLAVDLTESEGTLSTSTTSANAIALQTVVVVDSEAIAYGTVSATGGYGYSLSYLIRGQFGTLPTAHAAGAPVSLVDSGAVLRYSLPSQYVGEAVSFKFCSRNVFGNALQDISEVSAYVYTPLGNGPVPALFSSLSLGVPADLGSAASTLSGTADAGSAGAAVTFIADLGVLS